MWPIGTYNGGADIGELGVKQGGTFVLFYKDAWQLVPNAYNIIFLKWNLCITWSTRSECANSSAFM